MTRQVSYSKIEKEVRPRLREKLNVAESTEDVKKFFVYAVKELLDKVLEGEKTVEYEQIALAPDEERGYTLSPSLLHDGRFKEAWDNSDLPHILRRIAEVAVNRYAHLEKHPDKTETKISPRKT